MRRPCGGHQDRYRSLDAQAQLGIRAFKLGGRQPRAPDPRAKVMDIYTDVAEEARCNGQTGIKHSDWKDMLCDMNAVEELPDFDDTMGKALTKLDEEGPAGFGSSRCHQGRCG